MKNILVGNLASETSPDELGVLFEAYGQVLHVNIVGDRATGRSRGFAFVEMKTDKDAKRAVSGLNGTTLGGKTLQVEGGLQPGTRPKLWHSFNLGWEHLGGPSSTTTLGIATPSPTNLVLTL